MIGKKSSKKKHNKNSDEEDLVNEIDNFLIDDDDI